MDKKKSPCGLFRSTCACITTYTNEDIVIRNTLYKYYEIIQIDTYIHCIMYTYLYKIYAVQFYTGKYKFP